MNQKGLQFYIDLVDELIANNIEPVLTLYHWDLPLALQEEYGGWENRNIIDDFVNYAETLFQTFRNKVKYWVSLNEQNVFTHQGWQIATHPPGKKDTQLFIMSIILPIWSTQKLFRSLGSWKCPA